MGLLEKAEKIQSDEDEETPSNEPPATVVVPDPEPAQKKDKPAKKTRTRRERTKKAKKSKKERVQKVMPEGFEPAGIMRAYSRYLVDFTVNFGLIAVLVGMLVLFYTDITYPFIFSMILALGNMIYLPSKFFRSAGNVVSGTQFVNTRGDNPSFLYHMGKSANVPFMFLGLAALMMAISAGTVWSTGMKIFVGTSIFLMLIPILDRIMHRSRSDDLGFWDTLFGGVWLVRSAKTDSSSGIMKRLESIGDYSESRGWMAESESDTE